MKTEAQWQKMWDDLKSDLTYRTVPRTDFEVARKLLLRYTGHNNKHDALWDAYLLAFFNRIVDGRFNVHHATEVSKALAPFLSGTKAKHIFPLSVRDEVQPLLAADKTPYSKEGCEYYRSDNSYQTFYPDDSEIAAWKETEAEQDRDDKVYSGIRKGIIYRQEKPYEVRSYSPNHKRFILPSLMRYHQVYDLLLELSRQLEDTPIYKQGDLAKILRVIAYNTGYRIAVKYCAFGFDHIKAMGKDLVDTFKPWKSSYYIFRDLKAPLLGTLHALRGLFSFIGIPFIFLRHMLLAGIFSLTRPEEALEHAQLMVLEPWYYFIDGLGLCIRGLSQVAATPLIYAIKIPIRAVLLYFQEDLSLIEQDKSIANLASEGSPQAVAEIHRKYSLGVARKRYTAIPKEKEWTFFKAAQFPNDPAHLQEKALCTESEEEYLDLFRR